MSPLPGTVTKSAMSDLWCSRLINFILTFLYMVLVQTLSHNSLNQVAGSKLWSVGAELKSTPYSFRVQSNTESLPI
jgi:hypothetical protein